MYCSICKHDFADRAFATHLKFKHQMGLQDYYDKYVRTENEGFCETCGSITKFLGVHGYQRFCSIKCAADNDTVKEKRKTYNLRYYNGTSPMASDDVKTKVKNTCIAKYGVSFASQADSVKTKLKESKQHIDMQAMVNKIKETKLNRYSNENYNNYTQIEKTKTERYGDAHYVNPTAAEQTRLDKYGVSHHLQLASCLVKQQKTNLERYGVAHVLQNHEIFRKTKRKLEYDGLKFDSKPEIEFYKKLKENFTDFEYQPGISFAYMYNDKIYTYHPDFRIGNVLYEIKGLHFFDENGKMINPFDRTQNDKYEAKHQCMIANGINIIKV